jgi:hypothetical protein
MIFCGVVRQSWRAPAILARISIDLASLFGNHKKRKGRHEHYREKEENIVCGCEGKYAGAAVKKITIRVILHSGNRVNIGLCHAW